MAKLLIGKQTGDGESCSIEIDLDKEGERLDEYFDLLDKRLHTMNQRTIAGDYMCKKLPAEAQMAIHSMMDILHGRKPGPSVQLVVEEAVEEILKQREHIEQENLKKTPAKGKA